MRPLVGVRRATAFDPRFIERDPLFWPLSASYRRLGPFGGFPPVDALARVFAREAAVRFVAAAPRRRPGGVVDARSLYDARITVDREVPTRAGCWHDLMNALVWGTFPAAKRALHARQHRAIAARIAPGARTLPPRTPELDALALVDEGGVAVVAHSRRSSGRRPGEAGVIVFGHAIYESLALGVFPAVVAALVLDVPAPEGDDLGPVDLALAAALDDPLRFRSPKELERLDLSAVSAPPS
jgi:hypothetical protein